MPFKCAICEDEGYYKWHMSFGGNVVMTCICQIDKIRKSAEKVQEEKHNELINKKLQPLIARIEEL